MAEEQGLDVSPTSSSEPRGEDSPLTSRVSDRLGWIRERLSTMRDSRGYDTPGGVGRSDTGSSEEPADALEGGEASVDSSPEQHTIQPTDERMSPVRI